MNNLVKKLTSGHQPVAATQYKDAIEFKNSIDRNYVVIKFTETNGGTELGFKLNDSLTRLNDLNFNKATGVAHIVGELTLNYEQVRLIADIDLSTLKGDGYLELINETEKSVAQSSKAQTESGETIH